MTLGVTDDSNYNSIANAIRSMSSSGTSQTMTPAEMAYAIQALKATWGHVDGTLADQTDLKTALDNKANINSPEFVGSPKAITPEKGTNNTQLATTAFVHSGLVDKADINSPAFTGVPKAPTAEKGTNNTQLATTGFVQTALGDVYTKTESDTLFADKALEDNVYTKSEIDTFVESKADVISNTVSGEIVPISDGSETPVEDLIVSIDPVQDLNGYDAPFPPDSHPNDYTGTYTLASKKYLESSGDHAVADLSKNSERSIIMPCSSGTEYRVRSGIVGTMRVGSFTSSPVTGSVPTVYATATDIVNPVQLLITTGANDKFLFIQFFVDPDVDQRGATLENALNGFYYAPYSNICPISGWTGCNISRTGKNLLPNRASFPYIKTGITLTKNQDGSISISGSNTGTTILYSIALVEGELLRRLSGKVVVYGGNEQIESCQLYVTYYRKDGSWQGTTHNLNGFVLNVPDDAYAARFQVRITANANNVDGITLYPQMEFGSSPTAYEPYQDATYSVSFGDAGSVYGGTLDVTTGVLTVDREIVYLKTMSWTLNTAGANTFNSFIPTRKVLGAYNISHRAKNASNCYLLWSSSTVQSDQNALMNHTSGFAYGQFNRNVYIKDSRATTVAEAIALFTEENSYIVYELDTPITIQLAPTEVRTLLGKNNVWADTGDILQLTYKADTKSYVDYAVEHVEQSETATRNMITQTEESMVASKNYAVGDLLIANNQLLRAKQAIGTGNTITIGTSGNTEEIDLATVFNPYVQDSGWLSLTNASVFTGTIRYRKIGKTVYVFADSIKLVSELTVDSVTLGTIPSGFRPSSFVASAYAGNVNERGMVAIQQSNGYLIFYKNSDTASFGTSGRLNFSITYFTN